MVKFKYNLVPYLIYFIKQIKIYIFNSSKGFVSTKTKLARYTYKSERKCNVPMPVTISLMTIPSP